MEGAAEVVETVDRAVTGAEREAPITTHQIASIEEISKAHYNMLSRDN